MDRVRKLIFVLCACPVILGIVVYCVGLEATANAIREAGWLACLSPGALTALVFLTLSYAWLALNRGIGHRIKLGLLYKAITVAYAGNILTPVHIGGEPFRVIYAGRRTGLSYGELAGTVLLGKYIEVISFILYLSAAGVAAVIGFHESLFTPRSSLAGYAICALVAASFAIFVLLWMCLFRGWAPLTALVRRLAHCPRIGAWLARHSDKLLRMEQQVSRVFREEHGAVLPAFCCYVLSHLAMIAKPWLFFYLGWGERLTLPEVGMIFVTWQALLMIQVTPSGVGTLDAGILGLAAVAEMPLSEAQCAAFLLCVRLWDAVAATAGALLAARVGAGFFRRGQAPAGEAPRG